ncbi:MAG TPA: hypothetical protein DCQ06_06290 [Myxococcales bacterium]|nr:hypothetical protein [Myxococcales bacterium]HAN31191.1 hypothetical protein [Myxococcales bacterium]
MAKKKNATEDASSADLDIDPSPIDEIKSLSRVVDISVSLDVYEHTAPERKKLPQGNVQLVFKPFTPRRRRNMATMSDLGSDARPMGGEAARRPKS